MFNLFCLHFSHFVCSRASLGQLWERCLSFDWKKKIRKKFQIQSQTFNKREWWFFKEGPLLYGSWSAINPKTVIRVTSCDKSSVRIAFEEKPNAKKTITYSDFRSANAFPVKTGNYRLWPLKDDKLLYENFRLACK